MNEMDASLTAQVALAGDAIPLAASGDEMPKWRPSPTEEVSKTFRSREIQAVHEANTWGIFQPLCSEWSFCIFTATILWTAVIQRF